MLLDEDAREDHRERESHNERLRSRHRRRMRGRATFVYRAHLTYHYTLSCLSAWLAALVAAASTRYYVIMSRLFMTTRAHHVYIQIRVARIAFGSEIGQPSAVRAIAVVDGGCG